MGKIILNGTNYAGSSGSGGVIYLPTIYSEEEREIGCFVDGKPLYQKTTHIGAISANVSSAFPVGIGANVVDTMVSYNVIATVSSGAWVNLPQPLPSNISNYASYVDNYNKANDTINIITGANRAFSDAFVTVQYTKTADVAGSGSWTPSGANAVHYSTNEQVIGTWIDGKPRYEITLSGSGSYSAGSELVVPLPTNADKVIIMGGYVDIGTDWLPLELTLGVGTGTTNGVYCYPNKSTGIHIYSSAWTFSEYNVIVQYCKTTD